MKTRLALRHAFVALLLTWFFARHIAVNWAGINGVRIPWLSHVFDPIPGGLEPMPHQGPYYFPPSLIISGLLLCAALVVDFLDFRNARWAVPALVGAVSPGMLALGVLLGLFSGNAVEVLAHSIGPLLSYSMETALAVVLLWAAYRMSPSERSSNTSLQRTRYARR